MTVLRLVIVGTFCAPLAFLAQSTVPTVSQTIPAQSLAPGGFAVTIDLRNYFSVPGVSGQIVQFDTVLGRFNVELRASAAPRHVENFLGYVRAGSYANSFIHRSASFDNAATSIVQGGGFRGPIPVAQIPTSAPVPLEYSLPNERGTLAAARTADVNSATSQWYFNVRDNSSTLGPSNGGGYTVFGRVLGTGMAVVDAIAAIPRFNAGQDFSEIPLRNYSGGAIADANLVTVNAVREATLFPTGGGPAAVEFAVENASSSVVATFLSGSTLTVTPLNGGASTITVRAADVNGNAAETSFAVTVATTPPVFTTQPASQTVAAGASVVFNAPAIGAASFVWRHNGVEIPDETGNALVVRPASPQDAGTYTATAANALGSTTSQTATLTVVDAPATDVGRLTNLSILTRAGSGDRVLTVGAVVAPFETAAPLPLVIRGVGPTLAQQPFNVANVLPDPVITLFSSGATGALASNDDWGGSAQLANAFASVGAFELPAGSADSALVMSSGVAPGSYTVQVTGKAGTSGVVIAELYDALGGARTANSPRLINVSTLTKIDPNADLTLGFVIAGQTARTVLVRGVGPSLSTFNVSDLMADPRLELFNNHTQQKIGENDNWGGEFQLSTTATAVGAFPLLGGLSQDAVMLITLAPGAYSARVKGANGAGGSVIVEVYEVP